MLNQQTECHPADRFIELQGMDDFDAYYFNKCLNAVMGSQTGSAVEPKASLETIKFHAEAISAWCDFFITRKNHKSAD